MSGILDPVGIVVLSGNGEGGFLGGGGGMVVDCLGCIGLTWNAGGGGGGYPRNRRAFAAALIKFDKS